MSLNSLDLSDQASHHRIMHGLIFDPGSTTPRPLTGRQTGDAGQSERLLQSLLFEHPALVPLDRIDPGAGAFIPICRELALPGGGSNRSLDIFGVSRAGRPVLIECKLWRNHQARREVVAQILEYAALLQRLTFPDLSARLARRLGGAGPNPLFEAARRHDPDLQEVAFVETMSRCLTAGEFDLIIAGDGIRVDLQAIAEYIHGRNRTIARLSLVEYHVWTDDAGGRVVLPFIPFQTSVFPQRVLVDQRGHLIRPDGSEEEAAVVDGIDPVAASGRAARRAFWERFIGLARFDHPDQPPPRHGGDNWVRIDLPPPGWITAYRSNGKAGVFVRLTGEGASEAYNALLADSAALEAEVSQPLAFVPTAGRSGVFDIEATRPFDTVDPATEEAQRRWLLDTVNLFVTAFRPRLAS